MKKLLSEQKGYGSIHIWLTYHYGGANKCENQECKSESPKRFEWALRKGAEYEKNVLNFIMLCPSCHRKYDSDNSPKSKEVRDRISAGCKGKKKCPKIYRSPVRIRPKLNEKEILEFYIGGMPMSHIAIKYKTTRYMISRIIPVSLVRFRKSIKSL